ncbi:MAG: GNAT family N-acetyltransferase [Chloroflexi bacterium]|nr:GNAT family N-acetyltransferase [Chloroflexota bacterium]
MTQPPALPRLVGERVALRPLEDRDLDALVQIVESEGVCEWWGADASHEVTREDLRNEGAAFAIEVGGELAGWLGVVEELTPNYHSAGLDIVLAAPFQGAGLGPEALRLVAAWLIGERGHHRLTIDPAAANERAIGAYASLGFKPVGIMRRYERGPDGVWRDGLLMDLLAQELT